MNHYSFSLESKQKSDAEKLLARAEEFMKEHDPDGNSGVKFDFFERGGVFWNRRRKPRTHTGRFGIQRHFRCMSRKCTLISFGVITCLSGIFLFLLA